MENWKINRVDNTEYKPDDTGIYVLIYWDVKTESVRLDFMSRKHEPIQSFCGTAENVRKHSMRYIHKISRVNWPNSGFDISLEHAAYIGSELQLADVMRIDYVQDAKFEQTSDKVIKLSELITSDKVCSKCGYSSDNLEMTDEQLIDKTTSDNKTAAKINEEKYS